MDSMEFITNDCLYSNVKIVFAEHKGRVKLLLQTAIQQPPLSLLHVKGQTWVQLGSLSLHPHYKLLQKHHTLIADILAAKACLAIMYYKSNKT